MINETINTDRKTNTPINMNNINVYCVLFVLMLYVGPCVSSFISKSIFQLNLLASKK